MEPIVITNIGQLVSFQPLVDQKRYHSVNPADAGIIEQAWLLIKDGRIADIGQGDCPYSSIAQHDAQQQLLLPGFVDSHTHPIFAGSRAHEFCARLEGQSYQDIAAAGGGIRSTVTSTREAADDVLKQNIAQHMQRSVSQGITTVEAKSGYGLSVAEELRHLKLLKDVAATAEPHIEATCLALHAIPPEVSKADYIQDVVTNLLPKVASDKLANWVDAFVEQGYFSPEDCAEYFATAQKLGLGIRVHADEFVESGGALAAAQWSAKSADHLQGASEESIQQLAAKGVVATLLPGTSLYTNIAFAQAENFRQHKCAIAIASDYNPGSNMIANLSFLATMAAIHCGLNWAEALAGITCVAAKSLGLEQSKGALVQGYDADFSLFPFDSAQQWLASAGEHLPSSVWVRGMKIR